MLKKEKKKIITGRQILEIVAFMNKKILLWAIPGNCLEFTSRKYKGFPPIHAYIIPRSPVLNKFNSKPPQQQANHHNNSKSPQQKTPPVICTFLTELYIVQ